MSRGVRSFLVSTLAMGLLLGGVAQTVGAQPAPPQPTNQPPEFAAVRARFENMTADQVAAAGYVANPPECVSSPLGGMGIHALNIQVLQSQLQSGTLDPQNPAVVLLDSTMSKVVGVEWEMVANVPQAPVLFGQTGQLQPGHPGMEGDHYMFHAYFKPNNQVLLTDFDPAVTCPAAPGGGTTPGMPTTGDSIIYVPVAGLGLSILLVGAGVAMRRARPLVR